MIPFIGIVQTEKCRRWQHRMKKQQKWMRAPIPVLPQVPPCCTGRRLAPRSLCLPKENRGASSMCWLPHPLTEGDPTPGLTPLQRQKEVWGQGRDRQTGNNNKTSCKPGNTKHTACQLQRCYTNHSHSTQHTQVQDAHSACTTYVKSPTPFDASHQHSIQLGPLCSEVHKLQKPQVQKTRLSVTKASFHTNKKQPSTLMTAPSAPLISTAASVT